MTDPDERELLSGRLAAAGVPSPAADARWLLDHGREHHLTVGQLESLVARRLQREPLQLILGEAWFRHVRLSCRPGVFVPRPETEVVAGVAIALAGVSGAVPRVVEPCTGTGAITCALVTEVDGVEVIATDSSEAAVALARLNIGAALAGELGHPLATAATATVVQCHLLDAVASAWRGTVDVLVANPPYLPASDRGSWEPEVAAHDPDAALVAGPDGHEVVDDLLRLAITWLRPGGAIVVEIDDRRGEQALVSARRAGLVGPRLVADLTGRDRAVVAHRPGSAIPSARSR